MNAEVAYESTKSILIPIYIALLALCNLFSDNKKVQIIFVVVCIIMTMRNALPELRGNRLEIEFYNDFISIVEKELILVNN